MKYDMGNPRLYRIYMGMKTRCYNKNHCGYNYYGAKGIVICDEWLSNYKAFYLWAVNNGYEENLTIDRIDPNLNYEPSNCRWITMAEQQRNRSKHLRVEYNGEEKMLSELAEITGIDRNTLAVRYYRGGLRGDDLIKAVEHKDIDEEAFVMDARTMKCRELSEKYGVHRNTVTRLKKKYGIDKKSLK